MRTVTISTSFTYMVGAPDVDIQISRDIAARDVTEKFKAAATAAIIHYYGRHPEDFKADDTPFVVNTVPESKAWQINDKQTGYFIFGATPCRVDSNDIEIQSLEDAAPRFQRTIYICQDYTTCVPE